MNYTLKNTKEFNNKNNSIDYNKTYIELCIFCHTKMYLI